MPASELVEICAGIQGAIAKNQHVRVIAGSPAMHRLEMGSPGK
jgi:hypothetical protein